MSHAPATQVLWVDALAVVSDAQAKLACTIRDFSFDVTRIRVAECIAQRFARYSVDVVPDNRMQVTRRALDGDAEPRGAVPCAAVVEFSGQRRDRLRQFVTHDRGGSQILNRIAAFS